MAGTKRAHVIVTGLVQGVFFRRQTFRHADLRKVRGWIRNCEDGSVEAAFEGEASAVEDMVVWCGSGAANAVVSNVQVEWQEPVGDVGFRIRP